MREIMQSEENTNVKKTAKNLSLQTVWVSGLVGNVFDEWAWHFISCVGLYTWYYVFYRMLMNTDALHALCV